MTQRFLPDSQAMLNTSIRVAACMAKPVGLTIALCKYTGLISVFRRTLHAWLLPGIPHLTNPSEATDFDYFESTSASSF
jgi:hypothetical protein